MEEGRAAGKSSINKEKSSELRLNLAEHFGGLERNDFCDFEKSCKHSCHKGKIETNEQNKKRG